MNKKLIKIVSIFAALIMVVGISCTAKQKYDRRQIEEYLTGTIFYIDYNYKENLSRIVERNLSDNTENIIYQTEVFITDCLRDKDSNTFTFTTQENGAEKSYLLTSTGEIHPTTVSDNSSASGHNREDYPIAQNDKCITIYNWDDNTFSLIDIKTNSEKYTISSKEWPLTAVMSPDSNHLIYTAVNGNDLCDERGAGWSLKILDFESGKIFRYKLGTDRKIIKLIDWVK
ncbi:MAG: hypothetical protein NC122_04605 [Faecalibacterium sp.]|nr:hypothetical protein [Ruminococcus sp.]MCM1391819.1 hypothetical protein [Ruminococcus sp.]MCM1485465.1 hypothetical protein [Faecalibacterium sp.]